MFDLTLFWEYRSILWQGMLVNVLVFSWRRVSAWPSG